MREYTLIKVPLIKVAKNNVFELGVNGKKQFTDFYNSLELQDRSKFENLVRFMEYQFDGGKLGQNLHKQIKGTQFGYEFKKDRIRVYYFFYEGVYYIIAVCGFKSTQDKDIAKLKTIINDFESEGQWILQQIKY